MTTKENLYNKLDLKFHTLHILFALLLTNNNPRFTYSLPRLRRPLTNNPRFTSNPPRLYLFLRQ